MSSTPVVVLNTSVWISGVFFRRGIPARILYAWRDRRFEIVVTSETLAELERKLREKVIEFEADPVLSEGWMAYVRTFARLVSATGAADGVCRDPDDDKFLDAALSGGARYIVASDHDLQALGEYRGVKVLSPGEFAEFLGIIPPSASL
ncbi:MAG TPA: putative toxin-antitoxin system toxin component, PIN family [Thermoflexia bacterium]|nr:putative toxin-antitoxin system toxin component, PIN family [Thermoflexia bacterium]